MKHSIIKNEENMKKQNEFHLPPACPYLWCLGVRHQNTKAAPFIFSKRWGVSKDMDGDGMGLGWVGGAEALSSSSEWV